MHCESSSIVLPLIIALILLTLVYSLGWYRIGKVLNNSEWRLASFLIGLTLTVGVWATPLAYLDHRSLIWHMVQHLVLMTVAAPLILLGRPGVVLRYSLLRSFSPRVSDQLIRYAPSHRFTGPFAHPVLCWSAGTGCVILWHVPALFELGMRSKWWHDFEQVTFLVCGLLFCLPVIEQWSECKRPRWFVPVYLFLATLPCDTLSAFLTFCGRVVYSSYASGAELTNSSALRDQECAGVTMWVWVTFVYLVPAVMITIQGLSGSALLPIRFRTQIKPVEARRVSA
jgi:putative membrane protein